MFYQNRKWLNLLGVKETWASPVAQWSRITCNAGDGGSIPGSGSSPRGGNGNLAWKTPWTEEPRATIRGVPESWTRMNH